MRRIIFLCLCVATALKPVRQTAAVRPRARAPVAKAGMLGVPAVPRGGGRSTSRGRAGVAKPSMRWVTVAEALIYFTLVSFGNNVVMRLLVLQHIMTLDVIQTKWLRGVYLATFLALYILTFCKGWPPHLEPNSGFLTWSVLAYWAYALKQIYKEAGMAAVLSKEALGPAACAIAGYFLLANLPELLGIALRAGTGG